MKNKANKNAVIPILFGFFIMGFCDVVGITSTHVKEELLGNYSPEFKDTLSNLIPVALFSMFLLFSVPTGILMNKIGRKKTVTLSNIITIVAMFIPLIKYNFVFCLVAFALLGIANTILQVSLNPLLSNVVSEEKITSILTAGQFVKAISSFCGPFIAAFAASVVGNWQFIFPIYAVITLISTIWLLVTPIDEKFAEGKSSSFREVIGLLKDKFIFLLFLGILFVVGVDVGINTAAPKILIERCNLSSIDAGYGTSVYFAFRTAGAFIGAILLAKISATKFFKINIIIAVVALVTLLFINEKFVIFALYAVVGFSVANIFPIIYSAALRRLPTKANEISGLMITGVFGGAVIPFFMGLASDILRSQTGSIAIILAGVLYLLLCSLVIAKNER